MFRVQIKNTNKKIEYVYVVDSFKIIPNGNGWEYSYIWNGSTRELTMSDGYTVEVYYTTNDGERIDQYFLYAGVMEMTQLISGGSSNEKS